jgi:hypothetical protein
MGGQFGLDNALTEVETERALPEASRSRLPTQSRPERRLPCRARCAKSDAGKSVPEVLLR